MRLQPLSITSLLLIVIACGRQDSQMPAFSPTDVAVSPSKLANGMYFAISLKCGTKDLFQGTPAYRSLKLIISDSTAQWNAQRAMGSKTTCLHQLNLAIGTFTGNQFQVHAISSGDACSGSLRNEDVQPQSDPNGSNYAFQWQDNHLVLAFNNATELDTTLCPAASPVTVTLGTYIGASRAH